MFRVRIADPEELHLCLTIRHEVFVEGQGVPLALEEDGHDEEALHFLVLEGNAPVGTARMRRTPANEAKVERVAIREPWRGRGLGDALMAEVEAEAGRRGHRELILGAQTQVIPFYEKRGWVAEGPVFLDAGIPHRKMRLHLGAP